MKSATTPEFHIPTQVFLKEDILAEAGEICTLFGSRAVLAATSADFNQFQDVIENIAQTLKNSNVSCIIYDEMPASLDTEYLDSASSFLKKTQCDLIIGFGGLESINAAKAAAVLVNNFIFADELHSTENLKPPVNLVTMPAFPLFGFEISPMLYLNDIHDNVKKLFKRRDLFPVGTIIDPSIATYIDDEVTARTSVATLGIATESVISKKNNSFTNTLALRAIDLVFKSLPAAYRDSQSIAHRIELSTASVMAGLAFTTTELSASLALALALSSITEIDVPTAIGVILPHIMEYNLTSSPGKYVHMSKVMDEDVKEITVIEAAIKAVEGVRKLEIDLDIPQRLSQFEISKTEFSRIAEIAIRYPFIENAPRPLNKDEFETILIAAY